MSEQPAFGGGVYLADTSVWARARQEPLREEWSRAILGGHVVTCPIIVMELLHSTRSAADFETTQERLSALRSIAMNRGICEAAIYALGRLAEISDGYHRVSLADTLVAATAQDSGVDVLHYDRHYDKLAEVLYFKSIWAAPPGTLD